MAEQFIIAGWLDYGPNRDTVLEHFAECARKSREEPGCLDYTVCADPDEAGRIFVFERWASDDDLAEHFRTTHIAEFRAAVASYPRSGRSLHRFFVSRSEEFQSAQVGRSG
jgi:quinol monooxygenase YgiN